MEPLDDANGGNDKAPSTVPVGESLWIGSVDFGQGKAAQLLSSRLFVPTSVLLLVMQPLRALLTTCTGFGGLYQPAGAIRGTYVVHYHVHNSAGAAECEPVQRTVVVQPCREAGAAAACDGHGTLLTAPPEPMQPPEAKMLRKAAAKAKMPESSDEHGGW